MTDSFLVYFGVRYTVSSPDDIAELQNGSDPRLRAASRVNLRCWWGRLPGGEDYFVLIGTELGRLGVDSARERAVSTDDLEAIIDETSCRLKEAGLLGPPALHMQSGSRRLNAEVMQSLS